MTDSEFSAEALRRLTSNYEHDSDEDLVAPSKRLSLSSDIESSLDINQILSNYTSSPPPNNNNYSSENTNGTTQKTRPRRPTITEEAHNPITNYIHNNNNTNNKTHTKSNTGKPKKSQSKTTSLRYGIDDLVAEHERYKSHQTEKVRALNEIRQLDADSISSDSDVDMDLQELAQEKLTEAEVKERKQAIKTHQKLQKLIATSQEAKDSQKTNKLFTKAWKRRPIELTPCTHSDKASAPDCILFTGTVPPLQKLLNGLLLNLVDQEPFLKSNQFIAWLLILCCNSDSHEAILAAEELLLKVLNSNPSCKILTFQMIVDVLNDFGADLNAIGFPETKDESDMEVDITSDWACSPEFPLLNLQAFFRALSVIIARDLWTTTPTHMYGLLGICYHLTLDSKSFALLPELQRVMEELFVSLAHKNLLRIPEIVSGMNVPSHDHRTLAQCINLTPYGTPLTRFVRQNLAAYLLENIMDTKGIQYSKMGDEEMINLSPLIKTLKLIKIDQNTTNYADLHCIMNLIEIATAAHHSQFAKHITAFTKLHTVLQALSGQIKDTGGLFTASTVLKEFILYMCSKIVLMKNGYAKQTRQAMMQEYFDG